MANKNRPELGGIDGVIHVWSQSEEESHRVGMEEARDITAETGKSVELISARTGQTIGITLPEGRGRGRSFGYAGRRYGENWDRIFGKKDDEGKPKVN
jgi:hypothetical protein